MVMKKKNVRVMVEDEKILVSYDWGEWKIVESTDPLLSILTAVCYPDTHELQVQDARVHRNLYSRKLSTDHPDD